MTFVRLGQTSRLALARGRVPPFFSVRSRLPAARRAAILLAALLLPAPVHADDLPPLPEALPVQPLVKDGGFAVLLGLVESDSYGSLTPDHLSRELARQGTHSRLPWRKLRELRRLPDEPGHSARVEVLFDGPLVMSIPYTILGYHPGSIRAAAECILKEWRLGSVEIALPSGTLSLDDVRAFTFRAGRIRMDFDAWLDWLMGSALDDTDVTGIALFRYRGHWIGLALGVNDKGEPRSGSFDFQDDKVLLPPPTELRAAARQLRLRLAALQRVP
jgi:hypothetical protein